MAWLEPKTDWQSDDYINIEDFNRIRGNIDHLRTESQKFYETFPFSVPLADEVGYSSYSYVELWNSLESCLQDIVDNTTVMNVGDMHTYSVYDAYIDYNELNRLEHACLVYYTMFKGQSNTVRKLSFTLGNDLGVKI